MTFADTKRALLTSPAGYRCEVRRLLPFGLYVVAFALPLFVLAGWLLLVAPQSVETKVLGSAVLTLGGLWNLWRAWNKLGRPQDPPSST